MRLPRVRFTVRTLVVAVAIAAAVLGFLVERRDRFRRIWLGHVMERDDLIDTIDLYLFLTVRSHEPDETHAERVRAAHPVVEFHDYLGQMADKYHRASGRPWLPVAADPTRPPKPSREYVKAIINRYNRIPGEPDPPRPPPMTPGEHVKAIIDRYNNPISTQAL